MGAYGRQVVVIQHTHYDEEQPVMGMDAREASVMDKDAREAG